MDRLFRVDCCSGAEQTLVLYPGSLSGAVPSVQTTILYSVYASLVCLKNSAMNTPGMITV